MIKINKEKLRMEYKRNLKREKKRYNKYFFLTIFIIWLIYSVFWELFKNNIAYNMMFAVITLAFILIWDKIHSIK